MKILKTIIKTLLIMFGITVIIGVAVVGYVYVEVKKKYPVEILENYEPIKPSVIYDINGRQLDVLALENRDPIALKDVPVHVQNAFIAVEDKRFRKHHGLDYLRLAKAFYLNITHKGREGGSTITQQLVKNAFLTQERSLKRKIAEAVLATEMERIYTKDEILEYYLNTINFGKGVYGIKNASLKYFGVLPEELTIPQAAALASIPKSPTKYSKIENTVKRQKVVLLSMYNAGFLTKEEYEKAKEEELKFVSTKDLQDVKDASIISNSNIAPEITGIVLDELKKILDLTDDETDALFTGYKIYSTIDINMQKAAYDSFYSDKNLMNNEKLQAALISMDSTNGFVKAIVGGKNFNKGDFNRAIYANKQAGSVFKPVVYLAALNKGYPMNLLIQDAPTRFGRWSPNNYDKSFKTDITMLKAIEVSNNIASIKLLDKVGINDVKELWEAVGAKSKDFPNDLTLGLGTLSTNPMEIAKFYSAVSNGGFKVEPQFIYKVENQYGEVIYDATTNRTKVFDEESTALLTYMLTKVVENGTAKSAKVFKNGKVIPMAGKTGTTSDYVTAWFAGFTPNLTTVVYVGYDDNKKMSYGMTGSKLAIPIWKRYMQTVVNLPNYNVGDFDNIIDGLVKGKFVQKTIDLYNGLLDVDGANSSQALFIKGTEPIERESNYENMFNYEGD